MQGDGNLIPMYRNESNHMGPTLGARRVYPPPSGDQPRPATPRILVRGTPRCSMRAATRKLVSYACVGGSQGKLWWTPAAVLTCKSIVKHEYRGERPIELASSWFPPKCPPG